MSGLYSPSVQSLICLLSTWQPVKMAQLLLFLGVVPLCVACGLIIVEVDYTARERDEFF